MKGIIQVACGVTSPDTTLEEDYDAGRAEIGVAMGNEKQ